MNNNYVIYGGSSLISIYIIQKIIINSNKIVVFSRNIKKLKKLYVKYNFDLKKIIFFESDILNINKNLNQIKKIKFKLNGIFFFNWLYW